MFLKQILLCVMGISAGVLVSSGLFTVLLVLGIIPRFAGKTHTARKIFCYENAVMLGTITGCFLSALSMEWWMNWIRHICLENGWVLTIATFFLGVGGIFAGIFEGCLAFSIAEILNSIPIFTRRIQFEKGIGIVILAMAIGKIIGSLLYFKDYFYYFGGM